MAHKNTDNKTAIFETMPVPQALAAMAIPTVASQIISILYNLADTWFIGRTNNPQMIGASSLVLALFLFLVAIANLFGAGGGSLMARQLGMGDTEAARKTSSYSIAMTAIAGLAFSLICLVLMDPLLHLLGANEATFEYARQYTMAAVVIGGTPTVLSCALPMIMRNAGYSKEAGLGVALGGAVNIVLDPLLMFVILPDGCQVLAAGIATMLANVISLAYYLFMFRRLRETTALELPHGIEHIDATSRASIYSVGVPAAIILVLFNALNIVFNRLAVSYGDEALAAAGIVMKVERLAQGVGLGICLGMVPLIAYNYARGDHERMDRFFSASGLTLFVVGCVSMGCFFLGAEPIVHAFIDNEETVRLGSTFLRARSFAQPLMLVGYLVVNYMQAVNQGKWAFILTLVRHVVLSIPAMIILNKLFGLGGLAWSQVIADAVNAVISVAAYLHVRKKLS